MKFVPGSDIGLGELSKDSACAFFAQAANNGKNILLFCCHYCCQIQSPMLAVSVQCSIVTRLKLPPTSKAPGIIIDAGGLIETMGERRFTFIRLIVYIRVLMGIFQNGMILLMKYTLCNPMEGK